MYTKIYGITAWRDNFKKIRYASKTGLLWKHSKRPKTRWRCLLDYSSAEDRLLWFASEQPNLRFQK